MPNGGRPQMWPAVDYPVRLNMRTALREYTDTELWSELYRRGTPPRGDQGVNVTVPGA